MPAHETNLFGVPVPSDNKVFLVFIVLHIILGFLSPDAGKILINKKVVYPPTLSRYRSRIAYVKQQTFLIHDTLLRNIILDGKTYDTERLESVLQSTGLASLVASLPGKLDTVIADHRQEIDTVIKSARKTKIRKR